MIEADVQRLREVLELALAFAMDSTGERTRVVATRRSEARFYLTELDFLRAIPALDRQAREIIAALVVASPGVVALHPDLHEPLKASEIALERLLSAIVDVETDEPADSLWLRERETFYDHLAKLPVDQASLQGCTACGFGPTDGVDELLEHFERAHSRPEPREKRLVAPGDQRAAIEEASGEFRSAYDEVVTLLSRSEVSAESIEDERPTGGKKQHPWRDVMLVHASNRARENQSQPTKTAEAKFLLKWGTELRLPLAPNEQPPSNRTVEGWLAKFIPSFAVGHPRESK